MKRISLYFAFAASLLVVGTGCLKDKGFEDQKYGIQINSPKAVAFPEAAVGPITVGITSQTASLTVDGPNITLEQSGISNSDVQVTLQVNNALATAAGYTAFPTGSITVPTTVTIPAGQNTATVKLTFPNPSLLNPSISYGIGFTIASVSGDYKIAQNQKNIVYGFTIKNMYDGVYSIQSGKVTRYTAPGVPAGDALSGNLAGNPDIKLVTAGPNSVTIPAPANPNPGALYWAAGQNSQVSGIDPVTLTINPTTNAVTITSGQNATLANWAGSTPAITYNRYDPATKTFYLAFRWNPTANVREYEIVLKYKGPR